MKQLMTQLSSNTKLVFSAGSIVSVVVAVAVGGWKVNQTLGDIRDSVRVTNSRIASLEQTTNAKMATVETMMSDRFTQTAAAEWALRMKVANPALAIPDPREPSRILGK